MIDVKIYVRWVRKWDLGRTMEEEEELHSTSAAGVEWGGLNKILAVPASASNRMDGTFPPQNATGGDPCPMSFGG